MRLRAAVPALALVLSLALQEHASGGSAFLLPAFVPSPRPSSTKPDATAGHAPRSFYCTT